MANDDNYVQQLIDSKLLQQAKDTQTSRDYWSSGNLDVQYNTEPSQLTKLILEKLR